MRRVVGEAVAGKHPGRLEAILDGLAGALGLERALALSLDDDGRAHLLAEVGVAASRARYLRAHLPKMPAAPAYWQHLREGGGLKRIAAAQLASLLPPGWSGQLAFGDHLALPLFGDDERLIGSLALEMAAPTAEQTRLAETIAPVAAAWLIAEREARRRAVESARGELLLEIVRRMHHRVPLPELLALICRKTVETFGVRQATVFYHHARASGYVALADFGTPASVFERYVRSRFTLRETPHADEITAGRTVVLRRSPQLSRADLDLLDATELDGLALLPLRTNDQTRGTLCVGIEGETVLTPELIAGLEVVAHHASTAIHQARTLRASEKSARFNAAVSALALDLSGEIDLDRAIPLLCARAREMFSASAAALLLARGAKLVAVAASTDDETPAEAFTLRLDDAEHPAVRAFATATVVLANELPPATAPRGFAALLAIPLVGGAGRGGILLVADARNPRHFDPRTADEAPALGALAVTALRNLELLRELQETNAELRRVSGLKDQFLAHVSHDLRTPLNVIIGYGQLAAEGAFGETSSELADVLERMVGSAQQQLALVGDLLDLSRIELNTLALDLETVPLAPLFAELEFSLSGMLRRQPVRAVVRPVDARLAVRADRDRLGQILNNLLANASKFTDAGSIEVWAEADGDTVRIAVRDSGPGIAPEDHERIFEPFRQLRGDRAHLGSGLGLSIARRLSALMHGTLTIDSGVGRGSTFWLTLPVAGDATGSDVATRRRAGS